MQKSKRELKKEFQRELPKRHYRKRHKNYDIPQDNFITRLSPETKKGIFVVFLLVFGFLSFLGLFDLVGNLGEYITIGTSFVFGWLHFLIPIVFIILGYMYLFPSKYNIHSRHYIGLALFLLSSTGLLNLFLDPENIFSELGSGKGGGYFGMALYYPFYKLSGIWGTAIILFGLLIVSIMVMFDLSIHDLNFFNKLRQHMNNNKERRRFESSEEKEEIFIDDGLDEEITEKNISKEKDYEEKSSNQMHQEKLIEPNEKTKKVYKDIKIPIELLSDNKTSPASYDVETNKEKIKKTLANFGINVEMGEVNVGPTVTQFTLKPDESVKLSKIGALQDNLAMSLAAHPLRIEAPIPGKSLVGIEVPNKVISTVRLREIISDPIFKKSEGCLTFALGQDVSGKNIAVNLEKMPHLLIAGATGSGKSVAINSLILSLLYRLNPNELKLILVDPKRVELTPYNGIPHLYTPIITKPDKTVNALKWAVSEMDRRYDLLSSVGRKDIYSYNKSVLKVENKLSNIVIIIDELADVMFTNPVDVETAIIRLAQMARAVGIHLVLATQRPSVNVITGLIKANITSRIAFSVASQIDSRTILDCAGAEKLLGRGDMLFISAELSKPRRLQGAYVSEEEKERVIEFLRAQAEPEYLDEITDGADAGIPGFSGKIENKDALLNEAKNVVVKFEKASATLLQRRLSVGYARAAKLLDQLEQIGVVGPANGPKPRDVLVREEDLENQELAKFGTEGMYENHYQEEEPENDDEEFEAVNNSSTAQELIKDARENSFKEESEQDDEEDIEFDDEEFEEKN